MRPRLIVIATLVTLCTTPAGADDELPPGALAALDACPKRPVTAMLRKAIADSAEGFGEYVEATRVRGRWRFRYDSGGMGRWAYFTTTHVLLDKRCRVVSFEVTSQASERVGTVQAYHAGRGSAALARAMLAHLKLHIGDARDPRHSFGRFILRRRAITDPWTATAQRRTEGVEWLRGKPKAQRDTLWPDAADRPDASEARDGPDDEDEAEDGEAAAPEPPDRTWWPKGARSATAVYGPPAPKPWQRHGRYALWRADEGPRFRRGREALALYDHEKKRHAWVLATPLGAMRQGRLTYLGYGGGRFYVSVGEEGWADHEVELIAIDPAEGAAFELGVVVAADARQITVAYSPDADTPQQDKRVRRVIPLDPAPASAK